MSQMKVSKMIILSSIILLFSFLFISCGDDDPMGPQVAQGLNAVGGFYYKAVMGQSNDIEFTLGSASKAPIVGTWIHFSVILGDGTLAIDSIPTDSNGKAVCKYNFNGALGHAEIQALVRNVDTILVSARANTLIPGATGQGQYILLEDLYSDIKNFNGTPERIDIHDSLWILIVVYEEFKGVVFVMDDVDRNEVISDTAKILELIVNTVYTGKTKDSIGIGSTLGEVGAIYGGTGEIFDPTPPPAYFYNFPIQGIGFYTDTTVVFANRAVFEIHLTENVTPPPPISVKPKNGTGSVLNSAEIKYKRYKK